jgi:hypothetical protein
MLINTQGQLLLTVNSRSGEHISLSALAPGLYMLRLDDGSTFKIVKE